MSASGTLFYGMRWCTSSSAIGVDLTCRSSCFDGEFWTSNGLSQDAKLTTDRVRFAEIAVIGLQRIGGLSQSNSTAAVPPKADIGDQTRCATSGRGMNDRPSAGNLDGHMRKQTFISSASMTVGPRTTTSGPVTVHTHQRTIVALSRAHAGGDR